MPRSIRKAPSEYALQVWTLVARRGMSRSAAALTFGLSPLRLERILIGVSRRNAHSGDR